MDKVLKQRLVGAAILIALAVIFVPMLFDGADEREAIRDSALELPPPPPQQRELRRLPLDPGQAREVTPPQPEIAITEPAVEPPAEEPRTRPDTIVPAEPEPEPIDPAPSHEPVAPVPEAEPEPEVAPPLQEPAPVPTPAPAPAVSSGWIVQVASFSSAETAERIIDQLQRLGHQAGVDVLVRGDSQLHRIRTGPYPSRSVAEQARAQIAATVGGVEPVVREVAGAVPAASAAQPARSGFAVQVGSFAGQANADRLTGQLRDQGYDAFIHQDETGSRAIWRVRVGLFDDRQSASALQRELLDQAGLEGLIVSHP